MVKLELAIFYLENLVSFVCFLFSLTLWNKQKPTYLKVFLFYPAISAAFTLTGFILSLKMPSSGTLLRLIVTLSIAFHYLILTVVLFISQPVVYKPKVQVAFGIIFGVFTFYFLKIELVGSPNYSSFFFANSGIIISSFFYFNSLLKMREIKFLKADPSFWVASGILLGMSIDLPVFGTMNYLKQNVKHHYQLITNSFLNLGFIVMYSFFIKALIVARGQFRQAKVK